ncbi:MAG: ATP-dependent Clp protease proteolytic subunit [Bdellovibrionaceae bacterium]|nr:ATP-dependent Clp protease proteolytic subunit [Pseudobdellovibrionaceae bacterium]
MSETEKPEKLEKMTGREEEKELFEARVVLISSPVNSKLAHAVNSKLLALERHDSEKPIYMFINSPGGEVHSGFAIFDMARFIKPPVYTIVAGLAASMGSIIALCVPRERRFAFPNAKFLIHQPSVTGVGGTVSDIEIHARDLIETKNQIIELYTAETGQSTEEVRKALDRDKWMTAEQAIKFGLISRVIKRREDIKA